MKDYIGIIGTGVMGSGMATLVCGYNLETVMYSRTIEGSQKGLERVLDNFKLLKETKLITEDKVKTAFPYLHVSNNFSDLSKCNIIIEAVTEEINIKKEIFEKLEQTCSPETIFISVTSAISADLLAKGLKNKERFIIGHTWNPPYLIPLVEIVKSNFTDDPTEEKALKFFDNLEMKTVVLSKDITGFIGNRIQHAMFREALYLLENGVCTPEDIDKVILNVLGPRYASIGLMEYYDYAGLDLQYQIEKFLFQSLCNEKKPQKYLLDRCSKGKLGFKAGQGVYNWTDEHKNDFLKRITFAFSKARDCWGHKS